jgi:two-component system, OmpR family, response regulator AdeR
VNSDPFAGRRFLVLVVEDEPLIADVLDRYLRDEGLDTVLAANADDAIAACRNRRPDIALLDVKLPGRDGFELLEELRAIGEMPAIMLTARIEDADRLLAFGLGADDYVTKPFNPPEVVARVRAVMRRTIGVGPTDRPLRFGNVEIRPEAHTVAVDGSRVELTRSEFRLLEHLARHPRIAIGRDRLLDVLDDSTATDRVVDAHVASIRRKLRTAGADDLIETVRGTGYRLWPRP